MQIDVKGITNLHIIFMIYGYGVKTKLFEKHIWKDTIPFVSKHIPNQIYFGKIKYYRTL
jgi:hypothetical protein